MPPKASAHIEEYLHRIEQDINKLEPVAFYPNLGKSELQALKSLSEDHTIVIKQAGVRAPV